MTQITGSQAVAEQLRLKPACDVSLSELADLFTRSYTNYFVPMQMDAGSLSWIINTQTIDLASSHVIGVNGRNVGFIFISARGLSQRVAAMGVIPEYRGRGLGQHLLQRCIEIARDNGVHRIVLEVIDENAHALSIYRQLGFEISRHLVGYRRPARAEEPGSEDEPVEIDPREVAKAVVYEGQPGLPWQIAPEALYSVRPPSRAFTIERSAYAVVSNITGSSARLDSILVPRAKRRKRWGTRMLAALSALLPGREWLVPAVVPEDLAAEFFFANGFHREQIRQYEMVLRLDETSTRYPYEA